MPDHHPPHLYLDHTWYILSSSTVKHQPFLKQQHAKEFIRDKLKALIVEMDITLRAWVILDNHYHLLLCTKQGHDLTRFVRLLNGSIARQINLWDGVTGRQVWHNYWDTCIRGEADFWTRFNYIHQNPIKHGYVRNLDDWAFSSYGYYLRTRGLEWLTDCWARYPVVDFLAGDAFDDSG